MYRIGKHWYGAQLITVENSNKMSGENMQEDMGFVRFNLWKKRETLYKITLQTNVGVQSPRA